MTPRTELTLWIVTACLAVVAAELRPGPTIAQGADPSQPITAPAVLSRVESYRIHDADGLVDTDLDLGWGIVLRNQSLRFDDIDAPEVDKSRRTVVVTDAEVKRGIAARDALKGLAAQGTLYVQEVEKPKEKPVYGRLTVKPWLYHSMERRWVDVVAWLKERKHER